MTVSSHQGNRSRARTRSSSGCATTPRLHCTRRARPRWASVTTPCLIPTSMSVYDTEGLRVVDASSFPYVTNGNIYAPVMMLAEKAADLIAGNTSLPASDAPFYRYRDGSPLYPPGDPRNNEGAVS